MLVLFFVFPRAFLCAVRRGPLRLIVVGLGLFVLVDRNADRKADLITVHDHGGIIAEPELQRRQLGAEVLFEVLRIVVCVGARAVRVARLARAAQRYHIVRARNGAHRSDRNRFRFDVRKASDARTAGAVLRRFLLLHADRKGRTVCERTEISVKLVDARLTELIGSVVRQLRVLARNRNFAARYVACIDDRGRRFKRRPRFRSSESNEQILGI